MSVRFSDHGARARQPARSGSSSGLPLRLLDVSSWAGPAGFALRLPRLHPFVLARRSSSPSPRSAFAFRPALRKYLPCWFSRSTRFRRLVAAESSCSSALHFAGGSSRARGVVFFGSGSFVLHVSLLLALRGYGLYVRLYSGGEPALFWRLSALRRSSRALYQFVRRRFIFRSRTTAVGWGGARCPLLSRPTALLISPVTATRHPSCVSPCGLRGFFPLAFQLCAALVFHPRCWELLNVGCRTWGLQEGRVPVRMAHRHWRWRCGVGSCCPLACLPCAVVSFCVPALLLSARAHPAYPVSPKRSLSFPVSGGLSLDLLLVSLSLFLFPGGFLLLSG